MELTIEFDERTLRVIRVRAPANLLTERSVCKGLLADGMRHIDKHVDQLERGEGPRIVPASGDLPPFPSNGDR